MNWLHVFMLTALTVMYINYPPPELSKNTIHWLQRGHFFNHSGHDIFYIVEDGMKTDNSTLVCLHGFPTSSYDWEKVIDGLKEQYDRVVMLDFIGFGFSDKPRDRSYLITEQADIVLALMETLAVDAVHLLSHDYGDTVALELLHRYNVGEATISVKSLCMLNGGVFPETNHPRPIQKLLQVPYLGQLLANLIFSSVFKRGISDIFGADTRPSDAELADYYAIFRHRDGNLVTHLLIDYIRQRNTNVDRWVGALQKTKVPVHMIYGPADPVNPSEFVNHYKKTVPDASITVLMGHIGHYPQLEDPRAVLISYKTFINEIATD